MESSRGFATYDASLRWIIGTSIQNVCEIEDREEGQEDRKKVAQKSRIRAWRVDRSVIPIFTPLSYEEILRATTEVINLQLNVVLADSTQDVKTPSAGIMVLTPDAPDIPKINNESGENGGNLARFRSLDTPALGDLKDSPNEEQISLVEANKMDDNVDGADSDFPSDKKKEPEPKSSPSLVRSDTYVRENNSEDPSSDDSFRKNVLPQFAINGIGSDDFSIANLNVPEFRKKLNILREVATEVVRKIDDLETVVPENTRPIRRLSTIGCFPGLSRNSVAARTIQRPKMGRRSLTTFPGTPTSSRMSPGAGKPDFPGMKSATSVAALVTAKHSRLAIPSAVRSASSGALKIEKKDSPSSSQVSRLPSAKIMKSSPSALRSASSGALKLVKKSLKSPNQGFVSSNTRGSKSPALSLLNLSSEIQERPTLRNPKYAHVASTIPKPGTVLGKRKADHV